MGLGLGPAVCVFNFSVASIISCAMLSPTQVKSFYVRCPLHGTLSRSCSKQYSRGGSDDANVRALMFWLIQGRVMINKSFIIQMFWISDFHFHSRV